MSNCLSDRPRYERDGAAVEARLDAFLQVGRQFLLVSRHLFLMAILARARIGLLLFGHRCFSLTRAYSGARECPGTRPDKRFAPHCKHVAAPGCGARASAATGIRKRRSRAERGAAMPGPEAPVPARPKAVRANLSGPRSPPTTRYCSRQIATVSQAEHQTPEMHDASEHPARMCGRPLPWTDAGVHARAAGARAGRPQRASREPRPRRPHPGDSNTLHRFTGPLRVRRASAEMTHRPAPPAHR